MNCLVFKSFDCLLLTNYRLINETLAKDDALVRPLQALLNDEALRGEGAAGHDPALVVEVAEDDVDALVLLAKEVLDGHLDVVKGDVGGAGGGGVGRLDGLGLDAGAALNQQHAEGLAGADADDEVVAEDTVGDPLLGAVDNL